MSTTQKVYAQRFDIPVEQWLDLSTGVNPNGWPVPEISANVWNRLPEDEDGLVAAARQYYGVESILPVAGSQAAIQTIPKLISPSKVAIPTPAYAEHAHAWKQAGHEVEAIEFEQVEEVIEDVDALVVVNPNNPTGHSYSVNELLDFHSHLARRGGYLVVDEAFVDCTPEQSVSLFSYREGLIVLSSLGKFFGLAGARVGFVLAAQTYLSELRELLGPWTIAAPSRYVARQALLDKTWQNKNRTHLLKQSQRLSSLLGDAGLEPAGGTALFQWVKTEQAKEIHIKLCQQAILTRIFNQPSSIRFGLPASEDEWQKLQDALSVV